MRRPGRVSSFDKAGVEAFLEVGSRVVRVELLLRDVGVSSVVVVGAALLLLGRLLLEEAFCGCECKVSNRDIAPRVSATYLTA